MNLSYAGADRLGDAGRGTGRYCEQGRSVQASDGAPGLPRLHEPDRFTAWLLTIARRTMADHLRGC
ncbi:hypothetical protein OHT76_01010 [Streptomyces sp. NBC_00287]